MDHPVSPTRIDYVDALRGLSALYVLVYHALMVVYGNQARLFADPLLGTILAPFAYGRAGVDCFLVLSGFVLYYPIACGKRREEGYARFISRRAWRLFPTYYAALLLGLGLLWIPAIARYAYEGGGLTASAIASHLFLIHNLTSSADMNALNPPLWSIPMEFQLYLVFPLVALAFRRWGVLPVMAAAILFTLAGRLLLAKAAVHLGGYNMLVNSIPGFLSVFVVGMAAAHLTVKGVNGRGWTLLGAGFVVAGAWCFHTPWFYLIGDTVWGVGFALMLVAARTRHTWLRRPALVAMGRWSYSTYLVHYPLLLVALAMLSAVPGGRFVHLAMMLGLGIPAILLAAYGFHLICERPFLRSPPWLKTPVRPIHDRSAA